MLNITTSRSTNCSISGPYAALMSYLAEIHNEVHRSRSYMWLGVFFSLGNISLPCEYNLDTSYLHLLSDRRKLNYKASIFNPVNARSGAICVLLALRRLLETKIIEIDLKIYEMKTWRGWRKRKIFYLDRYILWAWMKLNLIFVFQFTGIAWLILPQKWYITFLSETREINSWRVFLAICSLPEFLACITLFAFPESPRFLILKGRHDEALNVFKKIYSLNTGKDPDTYPVILRGDVIFEDNEHCIYLK